MKMYAFGVIVNRVLNAQTTRCPQVWPIPTRLTLRGGFDCYVHAVCKQCKNTAPVIRKKEATTTSIQVTGASAFRSTMDKLQHSTIKQGSETVCRRCRKKSVL